MYYIIMLHKLILENREIIETHKFKFLNFIPASTCNGRNRKQLTLSTAGSTISLGPAVPKVHSLLLSIV